MNRLRIAHCGLRIDRTCAETYAVPLKIRNPKSAISNLGIP